MVGRKGGREKEAAREKQRQIREYQKHTSALVSWLEGGLGSWSCHGWWWYMREKQRPIRGYQKHTSALVSWNCCPWVG